MKRAYLRAGMKVKLKPLSILRFARETGVHFLDSMDQFAGKEVTIANVFGDGEFGIIEDDGQHAFEVGHIVDRPFKIKNFTFDIGPAYGVIKNDGTVIFNSVPDEIHPVVLERLFRTQRAFLTAQKQLGVINAKAKKAIKAKKSNS